MSPLTRTPQVISRGLDEGLHIGAQLYVSRHGNVIEDIALGAARPAARPAAALPMTPDTPLAWFSAGKPLTAAAVCQLWERGRLALDDAVARYVAGFDLHGKADVTIRHLLTHTSSVRWTPLPHDAAWDMLLSQIAHMRPEPRWKPGDRAGYSGQVNWYLLGEIVRRVDGRPVERYVAEEILAPLGMEHCFMALDPPAYAAWRDRLGIMPQTSGNRVVALETHDLDNCIRCSPGASMHGPARELARFYEMLLARGLPRATDAAATRLLRAETVAAMVARQRRGMRDETFKRTVDWGLGLILNDERPAATPPAGPAPAAPAAEPPFAYGYGPHAAPATFGHGGYQSSTGFCDPKNALVVALIFNGCCGEEAHARRMQETLAAIYEDLGLAPESSSAAPRSSAR